MLILTRTTPIEEAARPSQGMTLFYTDLDRSAVEVREIPKMGRMAVDSNMLFIDGLRVPAIDRIGEEGRGFQYILHGMNPERILIAAEAVGLGRAALARACWGCRNRIKARPCTAGRAKRNRPDSGRPNGGFRCASPALRVSGMTLLLRRQQVLEAAQSERVAGNAKAGDDALADRGGLRGGAAPDRVRDVHLDRRELDLRERGDKRRIPGAKGGRVEDRRIDAAVVCLVDLVDHLALDVRVEDLDLEPEF